MKVVYIRKYIVTGNHWRQPINSELRNIEKYITYEPIETFHIL